MNQSLEKHNHSEQATLGSEQKSDNVRADIKLLTRLVQKCIVEDREDDAARIFESIDMQALCGGEELILWARTAELLGKVQHAHEAYQKASEDPSVAPQALSALAQIELARGREDEAEEFLEKACTQGMSPACKQLITQEIERTIAPEPLFEPFPLRDASREHAISRMLTLFRGKHGVHARQWYDRSKDQTGYVPVHEPLSRDIMEKHLNGSITVGVYPLTDDNTVYFAALDIDVQKSSLAEFLEDPVKRSSVFSGIKEYMAKIYEWSKERRIPVVFEFSGFKGVHAWYFFEKPIPAACAADLLNGCIASVGNPPPETHVEIFPRQDAHTGKGFGNLIKLPLGIHKKSKRKSIFLSHRGEPIHDGLEYINQIQLIPHDMLEEMCSSWRERLTAKKVAKLPERFEERQHGTQMDNNHEIIKRCAMIGYLVDKASRESHLSFTERKVLLGVLGHLKNGKQLLHYIIGNCSDYSPSITDHYISKLKGTPLGCNKIRRLLFYLEGVVECRCSFAGGGAEYATPLNHLEVDLRKQNNFSVLEPEKGDGIEREVSKLRSEIAELRQLVKNLTETTKTSLR